VIERKKNRSVLYITYDGLLDPLGASQILPYLESIAASQFFVHILSFEKSFRLIRYGGRQRVELASMGMCWTPLKFTSRLGSFGKLWDLLRMYVAAIIIARKAMPCLVHARGHIAAQVGLFLKQYRKSGLIFDFRGLWVDERVDKGSWDLKNIFHRSQYNIFKKLERKLLREADHTIVLTEAVVTEVMRLGVGSRNKISVIPCCADFELFALSNNDTRQQARETCGINRKSFVLGYLGSVGRMYILDRFFRLVDLALKERLNIEVLALTPDRDSFLKEMKKYLPSNQHQSIHARSATRDEVAKLIPAIDVLVSFIQPSYARIASSPTKIAESFAVGIPVISNYGVGDLLNLIARLDAGVVVDVSSDGSLAEVATSLPLLAEKGGRRLREGARQYLGLEVATAQYRGIYEMLSSKR
jgi:glycosyltransferase involved in cell wall biosynthesis